MEKRWSSNVLRQGVLIDNSVKLYTMKAVSDTAVNSDNSREINVESLIEKKEIRERITVIKREAFQEGFQQGFKEGKEEGYRESDNRIKPVMSIIKDMDNFKEHILKESEHDIVQLSISIAKKIICQEIKLNKEIILNIVSSAIKKIVDRDQIWIKVNPNDAETLNHNLSKLTMYTGDIKNITIKGDESISVGGCIIETSHGDVNAAIESQLYEIKEELTKGFNDSRIREVEQ
ncbi:MAG: FliH/SctL family protein [Nitrospirota bacterium]